MTGKGAHQRHGRAHCGRVPLLTLSARGRSRVSGTVPGPGGAEREKMVLLWWAPQAGRGSTRANGCLQSIVSRGGSLATLQWGGGGPMLQVRSPASSRPAQPLPVLHACPHRASSLPTRGPWDMFPPDPAPVVYAARAPSTLGCSHGFEWSVTQGLSPHWRGQEPPRTCACWSQADNMLGKYLVTNVPSKEESRDLGVTVRKER